MIRQHRPHWIAISLAASLAVLTFEAAAQISKPSANAEAVFQGRPSMSGVQAGMGAMAGLPTGGIGLQGSDGAGINLRRPQIVEQRMAPLPAVACADLPRTSATQQPLCLPQIRDERFDRRLANLDIDPQQRGRQ